MNIKDILMNLTPKHVEYKVKAWDGLPVFIRALNEEERQECEILEEGLELSDSAKLVIQRGLVDDEGNRIFDDIAEMKKLTLGGIYELSNAIIERTMYRGEEAEKN